MEPRNERQAFEKALKGSKKGGKYILTLYVAGSGPRSVKAIRNVRELCDKYLDAPYELKVVDIYQQPLFAAEGQIVAAPTLIKKLPLPLKRFIGDMSNMEKLMVGWDIRSEKEKARNHESSKPKAKTIQKRAPRPDR